LNIASRAVVVSTGEPAGIGPDICIMLADGDLAGKPLFIGSAGVLRERIAALRRSTRIQTLTAAADAAAHRAGVLQLLDVPAPAEVVAGRLDRRNAAYVLELLRQGTELCLRGECAALVTAPVQKSLINEAGIAFTGHTEYLAELTRSPTPVMMLASGALRVALATTHLPLSSVAHAIETERLERVLTVLDRDLKQRFGIVEPRIRVLSLNPHAGEGGALGREEIEIIEPTLQRMRARGLKLSGPTPADTAFTPEARECADAVLAMYHDQGLPVIKALAFGEVVNITLGLPIIRTSVDHGTALDLAASGRARPDSLAQAYRVAMELAERQLG
jgi:4-hydroxythreonine-4-phosphate dehydrogenase